MALTIESSGRQFCPINLKDSEARLNKKYGIKLAELKNGELSGFLGDLEANIPFRGGYNQPLGEINEKIIKRYDKIPGFCSMLLENNTDIFRHSKIIYEISYNHYVFGKESDMRSDQDCKFPSGCCGRSAKNLFLSLMEKGYVNSSFLYNPFQNHAYVGLPFVVKENNKTGFIISDPTSDQLFDCEERKIRNNLFVVYGTKWEYKTDWKCGADLYPFASNNSKFSNLYTLRGDVDPSINEVQDMEKFFCEVFKNPVGVKAHFL